MGGRRPRIKPQKLQPVLGQLIVEPPEPPPGLGTVGQDYWRRLANSMIRSRTLTERTLQPLEALCGQWEVYCRWRWWLLSNLDRWTIKTRSGYEQQAPQVQFMRDALAECLRLWKLLRLNPEKGTGQDIGGLVEEAARKTEGDEENRPNVKETATENG
jgi:phage terminase small subunit